MKNGEFIGFNYPAELLIPLALFQEAWEVLNFDPKSNNSSTIEDYYRFLGSHLQFLISKNPDQFHQLLDTSTLQHKDNVLLGGAIEEKFGVELSPPEAYQTGTMLGSVGKIASGKGTFAEMLKSDYGFQKLEISLVAIVMATLTQNTNKLDRTMIGKVAGDLKQLFGPTVLLNTLLRLLFLNGDTNARFLLDGVRNEKVALSVKRVEKNQVKTSKLVGVKTHIADDDDLIERYNRAKGRGDAKDNLDFNSFRLLDLSEASGIDDAWQYVDDEIINDDEEHFISQITLLMLKYEIDNLSD